jgi:peptide chain release factor 1
MLKRLAELSLRYDELNRRAQDPNLAKDPKQYKEVMREHAHLSAAADAYREYRKLLKELDGAREVANAETDHDMREMAREELRALEARKADMEETLKTLLTPPDPLEEKNIIMEIRGGTGGDEAALPGF